MHCCFQNTMSLRAIISLPKRSILSNHSQKIDVHRFWTGNATLLGRSHSLPSGYSEKVQTKGKNPTEYIEAFKEVKLDYCSSSATISWYISDDENIDTASRELLSVGNLMKESFRDVAMTRPFFVLDGRGRRIALLSLLQQ